MDTLIEILLLDILISLMILYLYVFFAIDKVAIIMMKHKSRMMIKYVKSTNKLHMLTPFN